MLEQTRCRAALGDNGHFFPLLHSMAMRDPSRLPRVTYEATTVTSLPYNLVFTSTSLMPLDPACPEMLKIPPLVAIARPPFPLNLFLFELILPMLLYKSTQLQGYHDREGK